jgi:hypothetical protein
MLPLKLSKMFARFLSDLFVCWKIVEGSRTSSLESSSVDGRTFFIEFRDKKFPFSRGRTLRAFSRNVYVLPSLVGISILCCARKERIES